MFFIPKNSALMLRIKQLFCTQNCVGLFLDLHRRTAPWLPLIAYSPMETYDPLQQLFHSIGHIIMIPRKLGLQGKWEDKVVKMGKTSKHGEA